MREIVRVGGKDVRVGSRKDWRGLVASFVAAQDVKVSSRDLYARTLSQFFLWVESTGREPNQLTRQDILEYKDYLTSSNLASLTIGSYLVSVRKFFEWTEAEKIYMNIGKGIKTPKRVQAFKKQHLTDGKSVELLDHFKGASIRDYAIVNLILRTGLRTIEVVRADIGDITFKSDRRILRIWGKGRIEKDDFVVLSDKAFLPIKQYLMTRKGAKAAEPLFVCESNRNEGGRMSTRSIRRICKEGLQAIGMDGKEFTAHSLRHTTAVAILKHGGSITDVQEVLRHSSPVTSQIYTESIKEEMRLEKAPELMLDCAF